MYGIICRPGGKLEPGGIMEPGGKLTIPAAVFFWGGVVE